MRESVRAERAPDDRNEPKKKSTRNRIECEGGPLGVGNALVRIGSPHHFYLSSTTTAPSLKTPYTYLLFVVLPIKPVEESVPMFSLLALNSILEIYCTGEPSVAHTLKMNA